MNNETGNSCPMPSCPDNYGTMPSCAGLAVPYVPFQQTGSKQYSQNDALSITLFAFDQDEEISTHSSGGDAFVTCLDGVGRITIDGEAYLLREGQSIVMPAGHPHAVYGQERFKMLLVVVF